MLYLVELWTLAVLFKGLSEYGFAFPFVEGLSNQIENLLCASVRVDWLNPLLAIA